MKRVGQYCLCRLIMSSDFLNEELSERGMVLGKKNMRKKASANAEPFTLELSGSYDFGFPPEFLPAGVEKDTAMSDYSEEIKELIFRYKEMLMVYTCAAAEMRSRLDILNIEFSFRNNQPPMSCISTRIKRSSSLIRKMKRNNIPLLIENIEKHIDDVAGIRVVCSCIEDIYIISQAIINQEDIEVISQNDNVTNPPVSGYRSLDMIIRVPVRLESDLKHIKVEIQIRTIAMDFLDAFEYEFKCKHQLSDEDETDSISPEYSGNVSDANDLYRGKIYE